MECIFTCRRCGYQASWDNSREREPTCPVCSSGGQSIGSRRESYGRGEQPAEPDSTAEPTSTNDAVLGCLLLAALLGGVVLIGRLVL